MPTSGAASAGTVSESELSDSSHSDIDESIQHNTKKARLGLFAAYVSKKTAVSNMSMSTLSLFVDCYWTALTRCRTWGFGY